MPRLLARGSRPSVRPLESALECSRDPRPWSLVLAWKQLKYVLSNSTLMSGRFTRGEFIAFTWSYSMQGCRVAQLVKCLVTSGYPDGSWKVLKKLTSCSRGARLPRDKQLSEVVSVKTPMWFGATETWAAAGLLSQARRRTTSCGNGLLD